MNFCLSLNHEILYFEIHKEKDKGQYTQFFLDPVFKP